MKSKESKKAAMPYKTGDDISNLLVSDTMAIYNKMYNNPIILLTNSKNGLSAKAALDFLTVSGFTYDEFQETFKTTVKTIQNYVVHDLKLDSSLSEKLLKSFALFQKGIEIFGSAQAFHEWLNVSSYGLGNQIPFDLMDTITGITLIEEELIRIAYGDLA
jgi:uncharacterized protein (DUF2384 family)